jgi:NADPH:quinone reductase-like Zn-dependent oxidoreductase
MQVANGTAQLERRDIPTPEPGPGQLLVRLRAAGLNRGEFITGQGPWKQIGGEGAGEIVKVGPDVTGFRAGDRVMARCSGAFAEYALVDTVEAMAVPPSMSWEDAASLPLTYLVSFDMIVQQGRLRAGEWLLINGVSSGVGVASLQLGKVLGAKVIGTSGSAEKLQALAPLGLDVALCTRAADFAPAVLEATNKHGADLVINAVGGSVFAENLRAMAFEGRLATVGYVDGVLHAELDIETLHLKRLTVFGVSNKMRSKAQKASGVPQFIADVLPHIASGRIKPQVDQVVEFNDLPAAKARMEAGQHIGKIVLRLPA